MRFFYSIRYVLLLLTVALGAWLWPGVRTAIEVDNSLTVWFLQDDPALATYRQFGQTFGNDEVVIVAVHDPKTLLTPGYVGAFIRFSAALERLPDVAGVIGPGNAQIPADDVFGKTLAPLLSPTTNPTNVPAALANLPTLRTQLFTDDYRTARFVVALKPSPDFDVRRGAILDQIRQVTATYLPPQRTYLGGVGVIYAGLNALSQESFGFFLALGYLLMFSLLWWIYRRPLVLLYTVGIVAGATYLTLGFYGAAGHRLNLMSVLIPPILVLLGVMDAVHVINERSQLAGAGRDRLGSALEALKQVFRPCLFTAFTTSAGFFSLLASPMSILQTFGMYAGIGILWCLFLTYLLGALILPHTTPAGQTTALTGRQLDRFYTYLMAHRLPFRLASWLLVLAFSAGLWLLRTDTYTLGYFPPDNRVVQDHKAIQTHWGAYMPLDLLVTPKPGQSLHSPDMVRAALAFTDSARRLPGVGRAFGFHLLYRSGLEAQFGERTNKALNSRTVLQRVHQKLLSDYPQLARQFIHEPTQTGRITLSGAMLSARQLTGKMDTLQRIADATLGRVARVSPAGYQPLYANIVGYVTESQVRSLLLSFGLIFVLVWAFLRDARLAALTVFPNLFPVLVMLGAMGWLGIRLDTATASIAAVVLSICTDDSIHFSYTYRQQRRAGLSPSEARRTTIRHVGPAIVITALILFSGYMLMVFASLRTVQLWGLLTGIAIAAALFGELVIFPLLLERFDRPTAASDTP